MQINKRPAETGMQRLLTAKELASTLAVSLRRLEQMIANGEAPVHLKIGRLRRWRPADVDEWTVSQRGAPI